MARTRPLDALVALAAVSALIAASAAPWDGAGFNYQLGEVFLHPQHVLPNVSVYFIDLFDTPNATVTAMRSAGLVPICYFSTQYEEWRPDAGAFLPSDLGLPLDGWPGERWADVRSANVRAIMKQRLALCKAKGFMAADPDNTDGYTYPTSATGLSLTAQDTLDFLTFLSQEARALGLGVGLKNSLDLISAATVGLWDFAANEQCFQYNECNLLAPFNAAGKPIFNVEYVTATALAANICPKTAAAGTTSIAKALALKAAPFSACALPAAPSPPPPVSPPPVSPPPVSPPPSPPAVPAGPWPTECAQQVAVPSYYYPCFSSGCLWNRTTGAAGLAVINPASGPGAAANADYVRLVAQLRASPTRVLGYTHTQYGARDLAAVKADIDRYMEWYGLASVFIDEAATSCDQLPYYQELVAYAKSKASDALVVLNWGTQGAECYLSSANAPDIVVNFEAGYPAYLAWSPAPWTAAYPPARFWHLVHSAPATPEAFRRALTLSKARRAGWVYVTDDNLAAANPWDSLPSGPGLWPLQLAAAKSSQALGAISYMPACTSAGCAWERLKGPGRVLLLNPANGPGTSANAAWAGIVSAAQAAGALVLGMVNTNSGSRSASAVKTDISRYYRFYPGVAGVYLNQAATACSKVAWYQDIIAAARPATKPDALVALGWGSEGNECYLTATSNTPDVVVPFINTLTAYTSFTPAPWTAAYPRSRFWHVVHSVPGTSASFAAALAGTRDKRAGLVYVTSDSGSNPWDTLPGASLWEQQLAALANSSAC